MNNTIRQHPIAIFKYIGKYIYLLILPLIRGFVISLSGGFTAWLEGAWFDILFITSIIIFATMKWSCFTIKDMGKQILVTNGCFVTKRYRIDKKNITTLCSIEKFYFRPIKVTKIKIDTPAGSAKIPDLVVILSQKNAQSIMKNQKFYLGKVNYNLRYKPRSMALVALSAVSSNSFAGVVLISTFVIQSGQVFGEEFSDRIYYSLEEFASKIAYGIPPFAAAFALIIIFGWFLAFTSNLLKHYHFSVAMDDTAIEIIGGMFTKRTYLLPRHHINYIDIRQTLFTKLLKVSSIFVDTIGYGKEKDDMSAIFPVADTNRIHKELDMSVPEFRVSNRQLRPSYSSVIKYTFYPIIFLCLVPVGVSFLKKSFPIFHDSIEWLGAMCSIPLVWLTIVRILDLKTAGISLVNGCYTMRYSKAFTFHTVVIPKDKIISIRIASSIFQRLSNKCDVYVSSFSENAKTHCIKNLKRDAVTTLFDI